MRLALLYVLVHCCINSFAAELADIKPVKEVPVTQKMRERIGQWDFTVKRNEPRQGRFVEYTPAGWDEKKPLPLLIFLHGAGARTEYKDTIEALYEEYFLKLIRGGKEIEALVLCPQVATYWGDQGTQFLDQALKHYKGRFDPDRVYLTGLSSGGGGCWTATLDRHELLAAAVPICGIRKSADKDAALINIPIWAFHNKYDPYQKADYTRAHVQAIRAAGGKYLKYTEYEDKPGKSYKKNGVEVWGGCHAHAWEAAYNDPALWHWLFRQRRGQPQLALDTTN